MFPLNKFGWIISSVRPRRWQTEHGSSSGGWRLVVTRAARCTSCAELCWANPLPHREGAQLHTANPISATSSGQLPTCHAHTVRAPATERFVCNSSRSYLFLFSKRNTSHLYYHTHPPFAYRSRLTAYIFHHERSYRKYGKHPRHICSFLLPNEAFH